MKEQSNMHLQQIIGIDKKNPYFTICKDPTNPGYIYVFFGAAIIEIVPDNKINPQFKLLVARLYNAEVKVTSLIKAFKIARTTMRRWGDALKSEDPKLLFRSLLGQGAPCKLTPEINSFIEVRFKKIYQETHYNYSAIIRNEIKEIFKKEISSESLRPIFNKLKKKEYKFEMNERNVKVLNSSESNDKASQVKVQISEEENKPLKQSNTCNTKEELLICDSAEVSKPDNQQNLLGNELKLGNKNSLTFYSKHTVFCYHVGVLFFSNWINSFSKQIKNELTKQFLVTILLGAKNIEQTKLLDFNALKAMLGITTSNLFIQRKVLTDMATEDNVQKLLKYNAELVKAVEWRDFYYDPHVKHYTGAEKILKGWCSAAKNIGKVINMDFIHTAPDGAPVYVETTDNFNDMRERFMDEVKGFRKILGSKEKIMTFIIDRGIYSFEVFEKIADDKYIHIVTWEKGYKKDKWEDTKKSGEFSIYKARNNSNDLKKYRFEYIVNEWEKNSKMSQIIVKATNPKENEIEVSILTDDKKRNAEELIELMFTRWVQENDFKYEENHFGINSITSYASVPYKELEKLIIDKQTKRGEYKAHEKAASDIKKKQKKLLYKKHNLKNKKKKEQLIEEIKQLDNELANVKETMSKTEKEGSKIQELIANNYKKLKMDNKKYMDCIKIIARNIFYKALKKFKDKYNNYRDDHVIFRNLTNSHGIVTFMGEEIKVTIFPTAHHQPKVRKIIEELFQEINDTKPKLPDGSGRILKLELGKKIEKALFEIKGIEKININLN
ncbi:MAG: hypothetical protein H8E98_03495 [Bacteroidetes bacterium]|nr:hypothetical protein [Bacteroidota bacterium]